MATTTKNSRITQKHDIENNWEKATNFIPLNGEIIVYDSDDSHAHQRIKIGDGVTKVNDLSFSIDYNETIIGLSIDGTTITYIKGDGSIHSFETQDTNTTYSLATDEVTGLTKLYATTGSAEDGTMTQKAIKTELDKKVGVTIDDSQNTLIFII